MLLFYVLLYVLLYVENLSCFAFCKCTLQFSMFSLAKIAVDFGEKEGVWSLPHLLLRLALREQGPQRFRTQLLLVLFSFEAVV